MRVIALDPSLRSFGVFCVRDGEETADTRKIPANVDRLDALGRHLSWLSHVSAEGWDLCIVEDYAFSGGSPTEKNSRSVTIQAEVGGIARGLFRARRVPIIEVPIGVWKAVTGVRLKKETAGERAAYIWTVKNLYGRTFETTDECDAFLLYHTVKKCGTERPIGEGPRRILSLLESMRISMREV